VLDFFPLRRLPVSPAYWLLPENRHIWAEKLLLLIPVGIMFGVNYWARMNHPQMESVVTLSNFGLGARLMQACWVWSWYLWKPWQPFDLAPKYPDLLTDLPFTVPHLVAAGLVVGISALAFLQRRVWPGLFAAWICYLALLLPLTGLTEHPHHTVDRYSYIGGGIWVLAVAVAVLWILRRESLRAPVPVMAAMALLCGISARLAQQQALIWSDSLRLQTRMAESLGNHPQRAQHDVTASALLLEANHPVEATVMLRQALALRPELAEGWAAFGDALAAQNRLDTAMSSYQRALQLAPELVSPRQNFAVSLAMADRHEEAVAQFMELLKRNPHNAAAHHHLALSLNRLRRKEDARKHMEESRRQQIAERK